MQRYNRTSHEWERLLERLRSDGSNQHGKQTQPDLFIDIDALLSRIVLTGDIKKVRDEHTLLVRRFE
jgi:hypothetical protein